jgi:hypothetical protein
MASEEFILDALEEDGEGDTSCPYCQAILTTRTAFLDHISFFHPTKIGATGGADDQKDRSPARDRIIAYIMSQELGDEKGESVDLSRLPDTVLRNHLLSWIQRNPLDFFHLRNEHISGRNRKFGFLSRTFEISLNDVGHAAVAYGCSLSLIHRILTFILNTVTSKMGGDSAGMLVNISIESPDVLAFPITSPFLPLGSFSVEQFMSDISMVATSRPSLFLDEGLRITASCLGSAMESTSITKLFGRLPKTTFRGSFSTFIMRRKGFGSFAPNVVFENDCGLVALHLAILMHKNPETWREMREFKTPLNCQRLRTAILQMAREFPGIDWNDKQGLDTCKSLQDYLNRKEGLQLVIYDGFEVAKVYFRGYPVRPHDKRVSLILHDDHLSVIGSPGLFFDVTECNDCLKIFGKGKHKVCYGSKRSCPDCKTAACVVGRQFEVADAEKGPVLCDDCNGLFKNKTCFHFHKTTDEEGADPSDDAESPDGAEGVKKVMVPVCKYFTQCLQCGRKLRRESAWSASIPTHDCLLHKCYRCGTETALVGGAPHYCSIQKASSRQLGLHPDYIRKRRLVQTLKTGKKRKLDAGKEQRAVDEGLGWTPTVANLHETYPLIVGKKAFVFLDFETKTVGEEKRLVPFALVAAFMCSSCCFLDHNSPELWRKEYGCCGKRLRHYIGAKEIKDFILHLFFGMRKFSRVFAFAFNGAGFDYLFLLDTLVSWFAQSLISIAQLVISDDQRN